MIDAKDIELLYYNLLTMPINSKLTKNRELIEYLMTFTGCRIPAVRVLWEHADWVQFTAPRPFKTNQIFET